MKNILHILVALIITLCSLYVRAQSIKGKTINKHSIKITEVCSFNTNCHRDEKGNYEDWIEIYNYGRSTINLKDYYITNDRNNLKKFQFKTDTTRSKDLFIYKNTFRIIWCDKETSQGARHVPFRLRPKGGFVAIVAPDGMTIIDSLTFPELSQDVSYGLTSMIDDYKFFDNPLPSKWNKEGKNKICDKPLVKPKSSYQDINDLKLTIDTTNPNIYYSFQGSPFQIFNNKDLKFDSVSSFVFYRADNSCARSKKVYRTYIDRSKIHSNVVALTIDTTHLWNKIYGIHKGKNYKRKMSRPAYFEFFDEDQKLQSKSLVDIKVHGAYSRTYPQKSLAIKVSSNNNKKHLNHQFFSKVDYEKYSSLILRNAGNDFGTSRMKDLLIQSLMDVPYINTNTQAYEPTVVYLNGEYWGSYNMREKINSDYLNYRYGADKNKVDVLEKYKMVKKGEGKQFQKLQDFVMNNSMKNKDNIANLKQWIAIENYIDYQAIQIYIGNKDWPQNNVKCWRDIGRDGKWRWLIYDLDEGFKYPKLDAISLALGEDTARIRKFDSVYTRSTIILPKIIENNYVKEKLVSRIFDLINFTFDEERVDAFIDSISVKMEPEIDRTLRYWYPKSDFFKKRSQNSTNYLQNWKRNITRLKQFPRERNQILISQLIEHKWVKDVINIKIQFDPNEVFVYVNGISINEPKKNLIYPKGFGVNIEVISKNGEKIIYPKSWKKKLNGFEVNKSGIYSVYTN